MIAEELKQRIIIKTGLNCITPRDCIFISQDISRSLNRNVSVTTLKRAFGFATSPHRLSKYTIATLNDFADQPARISAINSSEDNQVYSFILKEGTFLGEINDEIGFHPQRMALEVLDSLLKNDLENSPIVISGKCIGIVYVKDLIRFLSTDDEMSGTRYHKFNFSLQSVIELLRNSN